MAYLLSVLGYASMQHGYKLCCQYVAILIAYALCFERLVATGLEMY